MKNLESIIQKYFESGEATDLPDVVTNNVLKINSTPDGFHSIDKGGHVYVIKKDGTNYAIYHAHLSKYSAKVIGAPHEPKQESGFYLDDVPVVLTEDGSVFYSRRDTRNSYDIINRIDKMTPKGSQDILYSVLSAFVAYAYSVYQFSGAYESLVVPPIQLGTFVEATTPSNGGGTTPSNP